MRRIVHFWLLVLCTPWARPAEGGAPAPGAALRIASYNVRKGTRARRIAEDLRGLKADIIALQEVDCGTRRSGKEDQPALLRAALKMHGHYAPSYRVDGGTLGMMVLSRFRLTDTGAVTLQGSRVVGAVATVHAGGRKLRVYSVHLSATYRLSVEHLRQTAKAREREAARVMALVATRTEPLIVAGDLNSPPGSKPYQTFAATLADCALKLSPSPPPTYPAGLPAVRIDYVFASTHLVPARARVRKGASDHLLLVVDLAWK